MIIVRLWGGLGNQMFQYATGRRLAGIHGTRLILDTSRLAAADTPREFELGYFRIAAEPATEAERDLCAQLERRRRKPLCRMMEKAGLLPRLSGFFYYRERSFTFDERVLALSDNVCLDGYWQSEKYFREIRDTLTREFIPRGEFSEVNRRLAREMEACDSVSLHVRRGDYVSNPAAARYHGTCDLDYYARAMEEIAKRVAAPRIFVFSDDPEWASANLRLPLPATVIGHNGASGCGDDMSLMRLCRHHIIANSSFSWWGAWLSRNPGKTVIAPARWFNEAGLDTRDLIPRDWLRI